MLVVGGGAAGHACVEWYRDAGGTSPVVLLSADDRPPYFRPHVSKDFLTGEVGREELGLVDPTWYAAHDIDLVLGCDVTGLDVGARLATTSLGPVRWGRCVLATGSGASSLPVPGGDDPDIVTVRAAADAERLLDRASDGGPVVIVGSGFVGCEVAASLRRHGLGVHMVSNEQRPQQDRLGEPVGHLIEGWLLDTGVELTGGQAVDAIERTGSAFVVRLRDHPPIEAAHLVVAVGARPRVELAGSLGLDGGIDVDATMHTTVADFLAVGDIANAWNELADRRVRVEHWGDAEAHGRIAGRSLAGEPTPWRTVPGFWSTIAEQTIKYVAWGDGHDDVHVVSSSSGMTVWYGREGVVVGVLTHEHDDDNAVAEAAVGDRWSFPVHG